MIDAAYQPVKRPEKLSKQVADRIQGLILASELNPGDRLPAERDLCEQFAVSRTVIREAISILEAKGLLASQGGSGNYVRAIQGEDVSNSIGMYISTQSDSFSLENLMELRRVLELQIVRLAAERATPQAIEDLESILAAMCATINDTKVFAKNDLEFHVALARASQNRLFSILLEPLTDVLLQLIYVGSNLPGIAEEACGYHRKILDQVKAHNVDGAVEAMTSHLNQTHRVTTQGLTELDQQT